MNLWSAKAFAIPASAILALIASAGGSPSVAAANAANQPPTEAALGCLLGLGQPGCEHLLVGSVPVSVNGYAGLDFLSNSHPLNERTVIAIETHCAVDYTHRTLGKCDGGPLESVQYLGANAASADVFEVDYMSKKMTYVISQPAADGRIPAFWITDKPPQLAMPAAAFTVTSQNGPAQTIYHRPD